MSSADFTATERAELDSAVVRLARLVNSVRHVRYKHGDRNGRLLAALTHLRAYQLDVCAQLLAVEGAQPLEDSGGQVGRAVPFVGPAGPVPGFVAGTCGHRVAESEWRAGFRLCERCV
jgi:hypothetical protein